MKRLHGLALALSFLGGAVMSHQGATGIVLERMEAMTSLSDAMKVIVPMARGAAPFDADALALAANNVAEIGAQMPKQFPEGSGGHPSMAAPAVWEDRAGFDRQAGFLTERAARLAEVAALVEDVQTEVDGDSVASLVQDIGGTCAACHRGYRIPDE